MIKHLTARISKSFRERRTLWIAGMLAAAAVVLAPETAFAAECADIMTKFGKWAQPYVNLAQYGVAGWIGYKLVRKGIEIGGQGDFKEVPKALALVATFLIVFFPVQFFGAIGAEPVKDMANLFTNGVDLPSCSGPSSTF